MAAPLQPVSFVNKYGTAFRLAGINNVQSRTTAVGFTITDAAGQYQLVESTAVGAAITIVLPAPTACLGMIFCFRETSGTGSNTLILDYGGTIATCNPGKVAMVMADPRSLAWVELFTQAA